MENTSGTKNNFQGDVNIEPNADHKTGDEKDIVNKANELRDKMIVEGWHPLFLFFVRGEEIFENKIMANFGGYQYAKFTDKLFIDSTIKEMKRAIRFLQKRKSILPN